MSGSQARFCTTCGSPLAEGAAFCTKCGTRRAGSVAPVVQQAAVTQQAPSAPQQAAPARQTAAAVQSATSVYGTATRVAGMAGMAVAMPWQTVYGGQKPDISAFLSAAALPAAQQAIRASLRRPGIAMAVTTLLDLAITMVTRGPAAAIGILPRVLMAGATTVLSLVTGSKGGPLRTATGVFSAVTMLVQVVSLGWTIVGGVRGGTPVLTMLPAAVALLSSMVVAGKTAWTALRRDS